MSHERHHGRATGRTRGARAGRWLVQVGGFAERYTRELVRNRTVLFWSVLFPVGFYLLTIEVFLDTSEIPASVLPYVTAGTALTYGTFGAIIGVLTTFGPQLAADLERDRYLQYRTLPVAPSADLCGRLVAGTALAFVALAAVVAVGVGIGGEFGLRSLASVPVVVAAVASFAVVWMVVAIAVPVLVADARYASIVTVTLAMAAYFLTGYNGGDPTAFQGPGWLLNWLPNTLGTRLLAHHLVVPPEAVAAASPDAVGPPGTVFGLALLAVYALASLAIGLLVLRTVYYRRGVVP